MILLSDGEEVSYPMWDDGLGSAYITGYTFSSNFPTTPNTFPYVGGSGYSDAFVVKIDD